MQLGEIQTSYDGDSARPTSCRLGSVREGVLLGILGVLFLLVITPSANAAVRAWDGGGSDGFASTAANWSGDLAPSNASDQVVLDGTTNKNMTWNLTNAIAGWLQTTGYVGTVTIDTRYGGYFPLMHITGDCVISNGTWTHDQSGASPVYWIHVTVDGDFRLGSNAAINVDGKGYGRGLGPGAGSGANANGQPAASYGGLGGSAFNPTYGLYTAPTNLGSSAYSYGGGAVVISVGSTCVVDGVISARPTVSLAQGSGGSIFVTAGDFEGIGVLDVSCPYNGNESGQRGGGGGRIAVVLTNGTTFGLVNMNAYGGRASGVWGAAGTIYRQASNQSDGEGTLVIDNGGLVTATRTPIPPGSPALDNLGALVITNDGVLELSLDTPFNLGTGTNLYVYGPSESRIAAMCTTNLGFQATVLIAGYSLDLYTSLDVASDLIVSNALIRCFAPLQTNLSVAGNLLVCTNSTLTHAPNGSTEVYKLKMFVGGDMTIAADSSINVDGMGYTRGQGPGRGSGNNANWQAAASHGGLSAEHPTPVCPYTYGSVLAPTNLGSSGYQFGGGAIQVVVQGTSTVNGSISANSSAGSLSGGSGGSVYLTTGVLAGNGAIRASCASTDQYGGGGGRIAVIVTNDTSCGPVAMESFGGGQNGYKGAAGTIYRQTVTSQPGYGEVVVNNSSIVTTTNTTTQFPPYTNAIAGELTNATLIATNYCNVELLSDLHMGDLFLTGDNVKLYLKGHDLTLGAEYHTSWGTSNRVVYDGGQIIWYPSVLTVEALNPTGVGSNFATLRGRVVNVGAAENPHTYFCMSLTNAGTASTSDWDQVIYMGTNWGKAELFVTNITSLVQGNTYVYQCYVTNTTGEAWSETVRTFTCVRLCAVTNLGAAPVGAHTAVLRAEVTDNGAENPVTWFHYWLDGTTSTSTVPMGVQGGWFSVELRDLLIGSNYSYNCSASNGAGIVWTGTKGFTTVSNEFVWCGAGGDALASTPANWLQGSAPSQATDYVRLDYTTNADMTWNLTNAVAGWLQTEDYAGTVKIDTRYGGYFPLMHIDGDCIISNGTWTHDRSSGAASTYWINLTVDGDFRLGSNALINVNGKGYDRGQGPGAGSAACANGQPAASYGGLGGDAFNPTYGLYVSPTNLGSSAWSYGGGAVVLEVTGTAFIDGTISARPTVDLAQGSGGSIFITAGSVAGVGSLDVSCPYTSFVQRGGGGGRIAVVLTNGTAFGQIRMFAFGGRTQDGVWGAAGTVYLQKGNQLDGRGTLVIDNGGQSTTTRTMMPTGTLGLNDLGALVITNKGLLGLNTDTPLNLGTGTNLFTYGPAQSAIAALCTTNLGLSGSCSFSDYALHLYTNLSVAGDLAISNATIITYTKTPGNIYVSGDLLIRTNGSLSHAANWSTEAYKLNIVVLGNVSVAAGGSINVDGMGYGRGQGPGAGSGDNNNNRPPASYGGLGAEHPTPLATWQTYGSILSPTNLGSGGYGAGGGAVSINVDGTTTVNGSILARSQYIGLAGGAGGSIYVRTGQLAGSGTIDASSQSYHQYGGGGGRVAVILTSGSSFGSVSLLARGGGALRGADGTVYTQKGSQADGKGILYVGPVVTSYTTNTTTELPPSVLTVANELESVTLYMTNNARVELTADCMVGDLFLLDDSAVLYLKGHTLTVDTSYHSSWGATNRVVYDGGEIIWIPKGTVFLFR